jgi:periplasmic copper chaperone A
VTAGTAASAPPRGSTTGRGWLAELTRAAAGPVACAVVLVGLLSAWVATGGAGSITPVRITISLAAVPMRAFTPQAAAAAGAAHTYLIIRNLSGTPDQLIAVRSPIASRIVLTQRIGATGRTAVVSSLPVPSHETIALSPLTTDVVLENPLPFEDSKTVPLTLVFRHAGQITIEAPVTGPGTP